MNGTVTTPDGRYLIVRGRLWRKANPALPETEHTRLIKELMTARRAVRQAMQHQDGAALQSARAAVNTAKIALGERGAVWWDDGAPDYTRRLVKHSPYATWYAQRPGEAGSTVDIS